MKLFLKWPFLIGFIFATLLTSCKNDEEGSSSSDSVVPGVIDVTGGFNVKANPPTGTNYYIHKAGDFDSACVVNAADIGTGLANTFIDCIIEVEELEGAYGGESGISMVMNVPPSMCRYVSYLPYYYFGLDYGVGPTAVVANFDADSNFVSAGSSITGPGAFDSDGKPICDYDYQEAKGPNCCFGTYSYTEITPTATTVTSKKWGGKPGNCAAGSGAVTAPRSNPANLPMRTYYFKPNGFNEEFTTSKRSTIDADSSLFYANYYSGAAPAAFKLSSSYQGNPYYTWYCLDDAHEEIARIRVQIREWNEITEFALGSSGDPDTSGFEAVSGALINDFDDWLDVITNGDSFPGMPQ